MLNLARPPVFWLLGGGTPTGMPLVMEGGAVDAVEGTPVKAEIEEDEDDEMDDPDPMCSNPF